MGSRDQITSSEMAGYVGTKEEEERLLILLFFKVIEEKMIKTILPSKPLK